MHGTLVVVVVVDFFSASICVALKLMINRLAFVGVLMAKPKL